MQNYVIKVIGESGGIRPVQQAADNALHAIELATGSGRVQIPPGQTCKVLVKNPNGLTLCVEASYE